MSTPNIIAISTSSIRPIEIADIAGGIIIAWDLRP